MPLIIDTSEPIGLIDVSPDKMNRVSTDYKLMQLPEAFGEGTIQRFNLGSSIVLMIHQYILNRDVILRRQADPTVQDIITFSFRNVFRPSSKLKNQAVAVNHTYLLPSVQVSSSDIALDFFFPAGTQINTIIIGIRIELLRQLMHLQAENPFIQTVLSGHRSYLYEEIGSSAIQRVAADIVARNVADPLHNFYLAIKAQELICQFFNELLKRETTDTYLLSGDDVKTLYAVRNQLLADLSAAPNPSELARFSGMSESKLRRLFKQVFGMTLYEYYQTMRMNEAARLIRETKLSVSETGYRLGFTNLSHFTRIFEKHIGQKPKKYAKT